MSVLALLFPVIVSCAESTAGAPNRTAATNAEADDDELDGESAQHAERERRAAERRNHRLQKQLLSDMQRLIEERGGASGAEAKLLVFGGKHHEVYLGCLCDRHQADSIFNLEGDYGSNVSITSLRNKFAPYGSNNEDTSACNAAASRPPSVVASDGKALGLLTLNSSLKKRIDVPSVADWLARMCRQ